jgi:hypothetical protein
VSDHANLLIEGPRRKSEHCEGCSLYEATQENGDECPYFGTAYRETEGEAAGLLCRPPECIENERRVYLGIKASDASFLRWVISPTRDTMEDTKRATIWNLTRGKL